MLPQTPSDQTALSRSVQERASAALDALEEGRPLDTPGALALLSLPALADCARLRFAADSLKNSQVGPEVAYSTGQSLFLTNICEMTPALYSYPVQPGSPSAYCLSIDDIDAVLQAATSRQSYWLTVSGGGFHSQIVIPGLEAPTVLKTYVRVMTHIQDKVPSSQVRGFSPDEIAFLSVVSNRSEAYILDCLKDHGLQLLEGFGAEILADVHRARIAPKKLTVKAWLSIVALAHERGIPAVVRLEAGPLENWEQRVAHFRLLRAFQETHPGAFQRLIIQVWPHPPHLPITGVQARLITELEALKLVAVARLWLGEQIPQIQLDWIPERLEATQQAFEWGASHAGSNDDWVYAHFLRGNPHAPAWTEAELRSLIQEAGHSPQLVV